jgi:class 3 adenylate cyclase/tetratricopeptide (TPR) repeat protein
MSFQSIDEIEDALRSSQVSVRHLYQAWEQRVPVPGAAERGKDGGRRVEAPIAWVQENLALARLFTTRALEKEEFLLVCDASREILRLRPEEAGELTELVRIRMNYAAALSRLGYSRDARKEIEPCVDDGFKPQLGRRLKADILLQLGDILREESYYATATAARLQAAEKALEFYQRALLLEPERLQALVATAAALLILSGPGSPQRQSAHDKAKQILQLTKKLDETEGPRWQTKHARAIAYAVLGDVDLAKQEYGELKSMPEITTARLADARFYAQFLAEALGRPRDFFKPAFPPLQLIVFAGHLPDLPDQSGRFPLSAVESVRKLLAQKLEETDARTGLVNASAGADLLFIEALQARGGRLQLVLPWGQEEFRKTSVQPFDPPGQDPFWEPLFEKAMREAATVREIGQVYEPGSPVGWQYLMEVTAGIALYTARASRLDIQPMALWDEKPGRGAGGTESFVHFWRHSLRQEPIVIKMPEVEAAVPGMHRRGARVRSERSTIRQEVKSMLFADIVGYSRLTEHVIPEFVETFLGRVSLLASSSKHAPRSVNTWGDAVYAVFDFAHDAGLFALELAQLVQEGRDDWIEKGLFWEESHSANEEPVKYPLNIRIGLHTGPVVLHYDPVVRRLGYTGAHVNRAARIEPVAKPGEVFASEEFAALAELSSTIAQRDAAEGLADDAEGGPGFVCQYAGSMRLAKGYPGRFRIYRVLPRRILAVEELARAAHEAYCAESLARGDTPATNSSLRPWEKLSEDLRDENRAQVADVPNKLRTVGYELAPSHGIVPSEIKISDAQVEELARREHERWNQNHFRNGWIYAPRRDYARKHHPLLVPWENLSESEKEKDRDAIRNLPRLIEKAGFRVRKVEE